MSVSLPQIFQHYENATGDRHAYKTSASNYYQALLERLGFPPRIAHLRLRAMLNGHEVGDLTEADRLPPGAPDFDRLALAATASDAGMDDKNRLWTAAFKLSEWHFIARGELPNVGPYIASHPAIAEGAPMLKAFTDTARLHTFAQQCGLTGPDGGVGILSLPVASILPTLESYASQGATHIHFNADECSHGFFSPLAQVPIIRRHLESQGLL